MSLLGRPRLYGVPLDAMEEPRSVYLRYAVAKSGKSGAPGDPGAVLRSLLPGLEWAGELPVESWLRPRPAPGDLGLLEVEQFQAFADSGGFLEYAEKARVHALPLLRGGPLLSVGVDHSLTGGLYRAAREVHPGLSLVVLDGHLDVLPDRLRTHLWEWAKERDPETPLDFPRVGRPEAYHAGSWLAHLLEQGHLEPDRLVLAGTGDLDEEALREETDPRVQETLGYLDGLRGRGAQILPRDHLDSLRPPRGPVYLSIDADVLDYRSLFAVRTPNPNGLTPAELLQVAGRFRETRIAALDIMEIDVHKLKDPAGELQPLLRFLREIGV